MMVTSWVFALRAAAIVFFVIDAFADHDGRLPYWDSLGWALVVASFLPGLA